MSKHDGKQMNMTENDGKRGCFNTSGFLGTEINDLVLD
jgi:hypothetical protein